MTAAARDQSVIEGGVIEGDVMIVLSSRLSACFPVINTEFHTASSNVFIVPHNKSLND